MRRSNRPDPRLQIIYEIPKFHKFIKGSNADASWDYRVRTVTQLFAESDYRNNEVLLRIYKNIICFHDQLSIRILEAEESDTIVSLKKEIHQIYCILYSDRFKEFGKRIIDNTFHQRHLALWQESVKELIPRLLDILRDIHSINLKLNELGVPHTLMYHLI